MLGRQELFSLPVCTSTLWEHTLVWQNTARLTTVGDVADPEASDSPADPVMVRSYLATCAGLLRPAIPRQRNVMSRKHTMAKAKSQGCLDGTVPILRTRPARGPSRERRSREPAWRRIPGPARALWEGSALCQSVCSAIPILLGPAARRDWRAQPVHGWLSSGRRSAPASAR